MSNGVRRRYDPKSPLTHHRSAIVTSDRVTMPIRDMDHDGEIAFLVDVYGVEPRDLSIVPGGGAPMRRTVERLGLDPIRFQATIWDVPTGDDR